MDDNEYLQSRRRKGYFFRALKYLIVAFLIVVPFEWFVAQPFVVSGSSMIPTFTDNEYLVIDKISYHWRTLRRGDVIIFHYPLDPSFFFIKRIVGLPGEVVHVDASGRVTITGEKGSVQVLSEPYTSSPSTKKDLSSTTLMANEYFVLGDNREESADSRQWGPLMEKFIVGRAFMSVLPFKKAGFFPGAHHFDKK